MLGGTKQQSRSRSQSRNLLSISFGIIIIGSCILFQLFWMKQLFVDKERYQFTTTSTTARSTNSRRSSNIGGGGGSGDNDMNMNMNMPGIMRAGRASSSSSSSSFSLPKPDQAEAMTQHQTIPHHEEQQQQISKTTSSSNTNSNTNELQSKSSNSLLDLSLIRNVLLREAPWAESHGANHLSYLGAGMLYYSMAYSFRSQTIVVLGSGGGYVPRLLKQAQRDLLSAGIRPNTNSDSDTQKGGSYELYLVDAHLGSAGWGSTFYAENENTTMKNEYSDIHYIFQLTDDAYTNYFQPENFKIDYLHIDADHGYEQSWKDFDNYSKLLSDRAIISFHDTCYNNRTRNCHVDGVPETIQQLKEEASQRGLQVMDMHYLYRGIAFAIRDDVKQALETPRDRRINFCVNNADLLQTTADGFTKNDRIGSLSTLGDFMECTKRYNTTELLLAKSKMMNNNNNNNINGIMAISCPIQGYRRNHITARCEKCIPGMIGKDCETYKYESIRNRYRYRNGIRSSVDKDTEEEEEDVADDDDDDDDDDDAINIAIGWLRSLSTKSKAKYSTPTPSNYLEVGSNAWMISSEKAMTSSQLLFGSGAISSSSSSSTSSSFDFSNNIGDVIVVDPISVISPLWIDPSISSRYRYLPCTIKDAVKYDQKEQNKTSSLSSSLDLDMTDTFICLSCDDLVMATTTTASGKSKSTMKDFLQSTFPNVRTMILGMTDDDATNKKTNDMFLSDLTTTISSIATTSSWRLDRDLTMSRGGGGGSGKSNGSNSRKRIVLLTLVVEKRNEMNDKKKTE
jgi:hypothetical protein